MALSKPPELTQLQQLQFDIHETALTKGWWSRPEDTATSKLLLIHSEISEAVEQMRVDGDLQRTWIENGKPEGFGIELADAVIRILDLAERLELDMDYLIDLKMKYNETRQHRHGGKAI